MPEKIAVTALALCNDDNELVRTLQERYEVVYPKKAPPSREEQRELMADAVGLIAGSEPITREVLEGAPRLRVISRNGVGYDAIDLAAAAAMGIVVTYVPDAMVDAVADLALGLLLAAARRISRMDRAMKEGGWPREIAADVGGKTLGLLGTGRIGMAVARRAKAFRLRLVGCDPQPNPLFVEELGGDYLPMDEVLEVADYVSLHLPASADTRGLIGAPQLARMKPGAFLINTARGSLVDEPALLAALREGRLAGAGLDVFSSEPPEPGSPAAELAAHPDVVATPHVAAFTPVTVARMGRAALANLLGALEGKRPEHVANPAVFEGPLR